MQKLKNDIYTKGNEGYKKWLVVVEDKNFNIFLILSCVMVILQILLRNTMLGFVASLIAMIAPANIALAAYAVADYKKLKISFVIMIIFLFLIALLYYNQLAVFYGGRM